MYYQFFRTSLPFNEYLEETSLPGFVRLSEFTWEQLLPANSPTMQVIHDGLSKGASFYMKDELES